MLAKLILFDPHGSILINFGIILNFLEQNLLNQIKFLYIF